MNVIEEITNGQVIKFFRLMKAGNVEEVKKSLYGSVEYATLVVNSAVEVGILTGGTVEDIDKMRTGSVVTLSAKVNDALAKCMEPDPN